MNDYMYTSIRNYLEEQSSLLRQNLAEQKRTNELLNEIRLGVNRTDGRAKDIAEAVQDELTNVFRSITTDSEATKIANTAQTGPIKGNAPETKSPTDAVGAVTVETVKAEPLKTTETVEVKPATTKKGKSSKPDNKPAVNWNS